MTNNNKEWEKEFNEKFSAYMGMGLDDAIHPAICKNFIRTLLQKERQRICEELEERFIDIWRNSGAKSKFEYYPTLKMLLDELEVIQKINE